MFNSVELKYSLATENMYGKPIRLRQGKSGSVLPPAKERDSYIVEFQIGRSMQSNGFTAVAVLVEFLELEASPNTDSTRL